MKRPTEKDLQDLHGLASKGLLLDTGKRKEGQTVWRIAPGKTEADLDHALGIRDAINDLAADGFIYDSGIRRDGQIVWRATRGKEQEFVELFAKSKEKK